MASLVLRGVPGTCQCPILAPARYFVPARAPVSGAAPSLLRFVAARMAGVVPLDDKAVAVPRAWLPSAGRPAIVSKRRKESIA